MTVENRPIRTSESDVVLAALRRAPTGVIPPALMETVPTLRVIGRCECGCPTVDFEPSEDAVPSRPIADGIGRTSSGTEVGIIVWGTEDKITGLELYELGTPVTELPEAGTIEPFESHRG
jgi:hypothetical protein